MKKSKKYDMIIYGSLILAVILLLLGGGDYLLSEKENKSDNIIQSSENKQVIERNEDAPKGEEPEELQAIDKKNIVRKYLDSILDQIQKDETLTYKMVRTWGKFEVLKVEYQREISSSYYEYKVDIKIPKKDAKLPGEKNKELSTKDYIVLSLYFDIAESERVNGYIVKNVDVIKEQ